jgi:hypothetical protein
MAGRTLLYAIAFGGLLAMLASGVLVVRELVLLGAAQTPIPDALNALVFGPRAAWFWLGAGGAAVWGLAWLAIERRPRGDERASAARKAYLYAGQGIALAVTLVLAHRLALSILAPARPGAWPVEALSLSAQMAMAFAFWAFLRLTSAQDGDFGQEAGGGAAWRRAVYYGLAAVALVALLSGVSGLLQIILDALLDAGAAVAAQGRERFAQAAALALVGMPAWWGCWWSQQTLARSPDETGSAERRSRVRRAYLYGCVLIAAIAIFFSLGMAILGLLTGRGPAPAPAWGTIAFVALICLVGHFSALRGDERAQAEAAQQAREDRYPVQRSGSQHAAGEASAAETAASLPSILVIDGGDGALGVRLLIALAEALPRVALWPMGLTPVARAAMSRATSPAVPDGGITATPPDALARATLIIGPSDMIMPGGLDGAVSVGLATAVAASPARKLLLPPRHSALRWIAAPEWPVERWIENAVIEAANGTQ